MSQDTVFELLVHIRVTGDDSFFTKSEIASKMNGFSLPFRNVNRQINRLMAWGYLDMEGDTFSIKKYRVKKKFCKDFVKTKFFEMAEREAKEKPINI